MPFFLPKNRKTITTILCLAAAYITLFVMQVVYMDNTSNKLAQRFDNAVRRSVHETAILVEENDMNKIIDSFVSDTSAQSQDIRQILNNDDNSAAQLFGHDNDLSDDQLRKARQIIIEALAHKYENAASRSIAERIDPVFLRKTLAQTLQSNGITDSFSFVIVCRHAAIVEHFHEKPFDFNDKSEDSFIYEQKLFHREVNDRPLSLIVKINGRSDYIHNYTKLALPILVCMTILLILLIHFILHTVKGERLSEIQKAFVKNMTHELKTPVASIALASEMLADTSLKFSTETYVSKSRIINNEAKRLTNIIDRVLQASILEQKNFTYNTDPVNINDLVTSARESFIIKVQQTSPGSKILLHLNANRPVIYADRMHITNVVHNLMDNALKYRDPSRPLILEVVTRNEGDRIFIDFSDNGIGIGSEYIKNIFDKFYRVPTGNRHDVKGFGLGLSYVHHVVTHNGGNISVQSEPNVGTRFTLDFQAFKS